MIKLVALLLLTVPLAACHADSGRTVPVVPATAEPAGHWREVVRLKQEAFDKLGEPRRVARARRPELILDGDQITFNHKPLPIGGTLPSIEAVLGPATTCDGDYREHHLVCWNNLGLWLQASPEDPTHFNSLFVFLNQKPSPWPNDGPMISPASGKPITGLINFHHDHLFSGYLEIGGAGIDAKTAVWEITKLASGYRSHCVAALRDCSLVPDLEGRYRMSLSTDDALEKGVVYLLELHLDATP